ncbi:MAG: hypothetical protein PHC30_04190, partial [Lentisphaeria bacterium]|nr:hypothetical protein [Lentisphaeria bacterium]
PGAAATGLSQPWPPLHFCVFNGGLFYIIVKLYLLSRGLSARRPLPDRTGMASADIAVVMSWPGSCAGLPITAKGIGT